MTDRLFDDDRPMCKRCGHPLAEHSQNLDCRTCKEECGLDASRFYEPRRATAPRSSDREET